MRLRFVVNCFSNERLYKYMKNKMMLQKFNLTVFSLLAELWDTVIKK